MQISPAAWAVAAAVLLFGLGAFMFARGWLGGGDVKLICASALLIGGSQTPAFLFLMSVIGSVLALLIIIQVRLARMFGTAGGAVPDAPDRTTVPYGVAVALAASLVIFLQIQRA
jgi:prepilin peptidase CpaA